MPRASLIICVFRFKLGYACYILCVFRAFMASVGTLNMRRVGFRGTGFRVLPLRKENHWICASKYNICTSEYKTYSREMLKPGGY